MKTSSLYLPGTIVKPLIRQLLYFSRPGTVPMAMWTLPLVPDAGSNGAGSFVANPSHLQILVMYDVFKLLYKPSVWGFFGGVVIQ